ncbi:unnamed protein product [Penicillium salamii]|uniref:Methyltransferase type 11 domain-containing protein n=1 Tax=Penicillium salamii TaxID=1612424 RepID=A0A9W4ITI4_9EURO|nr:unnamed protein product [Penicillium salamii]CAG8018037.1 unnamed protein product [Penicillium salamii]CAG8125480.1 unnamed protein product [Penicillium salamii]CAG8307517.1 unnamed protein product [Penicillium salamii]CAG8318562.1 unnamed protein product [Penicillium salamii]
MPQAYTNDHSPSVLLTHSWRDTNNSASYLLPHLQPNMGILDVGCGPGSITIDLARKVPLGHVVGVFDVVHAHQVLQHIADPVQAFKEMRRVVKPGGIVAVQESVTSTTYPDSKELVAWRDLQARIREAKGSHTKAGSHLHIWAKEAGFRSPEEREYWGGAMESRARSSGLAKIAIQEGFASQEDLENMAKAWRAFVEDEDGWIGFLHGQILCWK